MVAEGVVLDKGMLADTSEKVYEGGLTFIFSPKM